VKAPQLLPRNRVSTYIKDYTDFDYDKLMEESGGADDPYFGVGHGDFSEEHGHSPKFVVWAIINGELQVSEPTDPEEEGEDFGGGETHGTLWGHDVTNRGFKGRYEPETGRLTIVKPERLRHREVPDAIMQQLESKFKNITEVRLF
jgi:hypothetical protein